MDLSVCDNNCTVGVILKALNLLLYLHTNFPIVEVFEKQNNYARNVLKQGSNRTQKSHFHNKEKLKRVLSV